MDKSREAWKRWLFRVWLLSVSSWRGGGKAVGSFWVFHNRLSRRDFFDRRNFLFFDRHFSRMNFFIPLWKTRSRDRFKPCQNVVVNCGLSYPFNWTMLVFSVSVEIRLHNREALKTLAFLMFLFWFWGKLVDKFSFPQRLWNVRNFLWRKRTLCGLFTRPVEKPLKSTQGLWRKSPCGSKAFATFPHNFLLLILQLPKLISGYI